MSPEFSYDDAILKAFYEWESIDTGDVDASKKLDPGLFTKSGIMVGLGEERNEVLQLMDDLRSADVDFLTIGQYLAPSRKHHPVVRFVTRSPGQRSSPAPYAILPLKLGSPTPT